MAASSRKQIAVVVDNENDWAFAVIKADGKRRLAVF